MRTNYQIEQRTQQPKYQIRRNSQQSTQDKMTKILSQRTTLPNVLWAQT